MTPENASRIAITALQFIAGDSEQLTRFIALSGVSVDEIRSVATTPEFMSAVLDYLLSDEPTLLACAERSEIDPRDILKAKIALDPRFAAES